jgi:hypothetical protein
MTHAQFQREVIALCDARGLLVHYEPDSRRGRAGFPDLVIAGLGGHLFAELKTPGDIVRPAQRRWLATLEATGAPAVVWRPAALGTGEIRRRLDQLALRVTP